MAAKGTKNPLTNRRIGIGELFGRKIEGRLNTATTNKLIIVRRIVLNVDFGLVNLAPSLFFQAHLLK